MMGTTKTPLIIAFVADLMFSSKLTAVAKHLNYRLELIEQASQVAPEEEPELKHRPGEPVGGRKGSLFEWLVERQPALIIFDLENEAIPWLSWMPTMKSSPSTRRIPILAYASHVNTEAFTKAQGCGVDQVVARSRFSSALPDLLQEMVRIPDYDGLQESCAQPLPELAIKGLELFNAGEYYECHHALEEAWNEDQSVGRNLYKGILQIAVAYFQIRRGNYNGGIKLLLRMHQWLDPLPDTCRGINIKQLREDAVQVYQTLQTLGPERIQAFDQTLFKPVQYTAESDRHG